MTTPLKTAEEVQAEFKRCGITPGSWAKRNGFNRALVYELLRGRIKGNFGEAHRIAVALGIKDGLVVDEATFMPARQAVHA